MDITPSGFFKTLIGIVLLILIYASFTIVKPGHTKVKNVFGKVSDVYLTEGFHVVNPLASFTNVDTRSQTYNIDNIKVPSQDKLKTLMDVSVIYRMDPSFTPNMIRTVGSLEMFEKKYLIPKVSSVIREVGKGVKQSQDFFFDDVQQQMQTESAQILNDFLAEKGMNIESVLFRNIDLPQLVLSAIQQTKERQEQIKREEAQLLIVEKQAQQQVKEAEAREEAAKSNANAKRTQADAEAYRIEKEAKATANANNMINKSLSDKLIKYNSVKQWDGKYPTTMMSSDSNIMMALPKN